MGLLPKRKRSRWKYFLTGVGSILDLNPAGSGPPPLCRRTMADERAARMRRYSNGSPVAAALPPLEPTWVAEVVRQTREGVERIAAEFALSGESLPRLELVVVRQRPTSIEGMG